MTRKQNGTTMNVIKTDPYPPSARAGDGFDIIVTKGNGDTIYDFAYSQNRAWQIARQHAGI